MLYRKALSDNVQAYCQIAPCFILDIFKSQFINMLAWGKKICRLLQTLYSLFPPGAAYFFL